MCRVIKTGIFLIFNSLLLHKRMIIKESTTEIGSSIAFFIRIVWLGSILSYVICPINSIGVGEAVRFLVVGTIGKEERPPRGQLWMVQYLISLKYWPAKYTKRADPNHIWGLAILADSLLLSVNNILASLWLNCTSSVEITLFLRADILLQHRALVSV